MKYTRQVYIQPVLQDCQGLGDALVSQREAFTQFCSQSPVCTRRTSWHNAESGRILGHQKCKDQQVICTFTENIGTLLIYALPVTYYSRQVVCTHCVNLKQEITPHSAEDKLIGTNRWTRVVKTFKAPLYAHFVSLVNSTCQ